MKFVQIITAALAGTVADWDNWGKSLSSLFFKNTKNTKIMFASLQDEIAEMLTAPPSIFVPGHTVLDSSIPFIHVDALPLFDFSSIIVSSHEDLRGVFSLESIRQQVFVGPSAHQATMQEVHQLTVMTRELIAAQFMKWKDIKAAKTLMLRRWIMEFVQQNNTTTILPRYVWDLMSVSETLWQWRFLLQALTLAVRWSAASTTPWMALVLIPKILLATLRAFDVPHTVFAAAFPQLDTTYRLLQMIYGFYKAYRFMRACWNAARHVRRIQWSIRTAMAEAIRALANWLMRRLAAVLWSLVRMVFLWMAALIGFYLFFLR
jgi:hypothetical protein